MYEDKINLITMQEYSESRHVNNNKFLAMD